MIRQFPIGDVLHLIDLGITHRLLLGWKNGSLNNFNAKWSARQIIEISEYLVRTKLPLEFSRSLRGLNEMSHWKGTEYRSFLLYASIVVVKQFFTKQGIYEHFLNYYCAIVICSRHDQCAENYRFARSMITDFLNGVKKLYGKQFFTSNMHALCHLVDDVEQFGPLDSFSAYPFESKLSKIKKMVRTGSLPLSQVSRRITEMQQNLQNVQKSDHKNSFRKKCLNFTDMHHILISFLQSTKYELFYIVKLKNFCINTLRDSDKWILSSDFKVISVEYVIRNPMNEDAIIFGYPLKNTWDYFKRPVLSSSLQIFESNLEKDSPIILSSENVYCKMVKMDDFANTHQTAVFIPLNHSLL